MESNLAVRKPGWAALLLGHARLHKPEAIGLCIASLAVLVLIVQSLVQIFGGNAPVGLRLALIGGFAGFAATALGALPALALRDVPQRVEDSLLGCTAGMMLAASAFSLLLPGLDAGAELYSSKPLGALVVVVGMTLGVLLMLGIDAFVPHAHREAGLQGPGTERCTSIWLFVFAIAVHNLPEGMAIGVSFAQNDMAVGLPLTSAIAIQDIPEGLAVALAMRSAGFQPRFAVFVAAITGLLEPLGALLGVTLSSGLAVAYPIGLGLSAGAMIFVVSHEVIPETHRNGHQTPATLSLMAGFALMMVLDTALA